MTRAFRRFVVLCDFPVNGTYTYRDIFQISRAPPQAPRPPAELNDHPCLIEFYFEESGQPQEFPGGESVPQWIVTQQEAQAAVREFLTLLSLFTTANFFQPSNKQSWYKPMGTADEERNNSTVEWGQEFYFVNDLNHEEPAEFSQPAGPIDRIEPQEYYNRLGRMMGVSFDLPASIDISIDSYFSLGEDSKESFLSAATLFKQGRNLWNDFPSLSFAAFTSAVETLISEEYKGQKIERCSECNQEQYRVTAKFQEFFAKYGSPTPAFRKFASKVYKFRSKILHRGQLFMGELAPRSWADLSMHQDDDLRRSIITSSRICIINWLLENGEQET